MMTIQKIISLYFKGTYLTNVASGSTGGASSMAAFARKQRTRWPDPQRPPPTRENLSDSSELE